MKKLQIPKINLGQRFLDHLVQGILIFTSVLFALYINNYAEGLKLQKKKNIALESIRQELQNNLKLVKEWRQDHNKFNQNTERLINTPVDSLPKEMFVQNFLNLSLLTGDESFIKDVMTSTAWETSKSTGIISEFNYKHVEQLTKVYELQHHIINNTVNNILALQGQRDTHYEANLYISLALFHWHLGELIGQENLLIWGYEDILKSL